MTNPMDQFRSTPAGLPVPGQPAVPATQRALWQQAAMVIGGFVVGLYLLEFVDMLMRGRLDSVGVEPRTLDGLWGIVFAPVLHAGWGHLVANTIPLLVLGFLVLLSGIGRGLAATGIIWVVGGLGQWLFGGANSIHLGASVLVFGWLAYLIARGLFTRHLGQLALGLVVLVVYGGLLWGVFPGVNGMSWQGHLFGALGGVLAAWVLASDVRKARRAPALNP
ncbi:rhomboid family intramembrane serine protease [Rhodococcus tukisamuensis]|uniref:Membrane associated serine protease, rhomboid family n=1 Tax=Rhodococcus tukisamuensis TaxID=168276 RepID=A0A1G7ACH8_9NOCA|nr:rhomboid family intramembrane serine protease [Rhodococcus tukisamuensis]SDE12614.1 Membrane associated serine protease, rhomboid family [Rhodococcus tukisamuensis]